MSKPWYAGQKHHRDLHHRLAEEGFTVEKVRKGKSLVLTVSRGGRSGNILCLQSAPRPDDAISMSMQHARRVTRDPG